MCPVRLYLKQKRNNRNNKRIWKPSWADMEVVNCVWVRDTRTILNTQPAGYGVEGVGLQNVFVPTSVLRLNMLLSAVRNNVCITHYLVHLQIITSTLIHIRISHLFKTSEYYNDNSMCSRQESKQSTCRRISLNNSNWKNWYIIQL